MRRRPCTLLLKIGVSVSGKCSSFLEADQQRLTNQLPPKTFASWMLLCWATFKINNTFNGRFETNLELVSHWDFVLFKHWWNKVFYWFRFLVKSWLKALLDMKCCEKVNYQICKYISHGRVYEISECIGSIQRWMHWYMKSSSEITDLYTRVHGLIQQMWN